MSHKLRQIVLEAIKENKRNRNSLDKSNISPERWLKEFCVVSIDVGRRCGKTTLIKDLSKYDDLVVVSDKKLLSEFSAVNDPITVLWNDNFKNKILGSRITYSTIYIDEPGLVFKNCDFDGFIFSVCNPNIDQTIICLGSWF